MSSQHFTIPLLQKIILFASNKIKHPTNFALVNNLFRETIIDFGTGKWAWNNLTTHILKKEDEEQDDPPKYRAIKKILKAAIESGSLLTLELFLLSKDGKFDVDDDDYAVDRLESSAEKNTAMTTWFNPLLYAVVNSPTPLKIIKFFFDKCAAGNKALQRKMILATNSVNSTILHIAANRRNLMLVSFLLSVIHSIDDATKDDEEIKKLGPLSLLRQVLFHVNDNGSLPLLSAAFGDDTYFQSIDDPDDLLPEYKSSAVLSILFDETEKIIEFTAVQNEDDIKSSRYRYHYLQVHESKSNRLKTIRLPFLTEIFASVAAQQKGMSWYGFHEQFIFLWKKMEEKKLLTRDLFVGVLERVDGNDDERGTLLDLCEDEMCFLIEKLKEMIKNDPDKKSAEAFRRQLFSVDESKALRFMIERSLPYLTQMMSDPSNMLLLKIFIAQFDSVEELRKMGDMTFQIPGEVYEVSLRDHLMRKLFSLHSCARADADEDTPVKVFALCLCKGEFQPKYLDFCKRWYRTHLSALLNNEYEDAFNDNF